jgi:hypothetical protein
MNKMKYYTASSSSMHLCFVSSTEVSNSGKNVARRLCTLKVAGSFPDARMCTSASMDDLITS